jgi:hypothetical protein
MVYTIRLVVSHSLVLFITHHPPCTLVKIAAIRKPANKASPFVIPPPLNVLGIIDSAQDTHNINGVITLTD